jgi:hypothetical protein
MSTAKHRNIAIVAGLAAISLSVPALAQPRVSPLDVAPAPETLRVDVHGKDIDAVRQAVDVAARTVCSNAVTNHSISFVGELWCSLDARYDAMRQYRAIVRARGEPAAPTIQLSAR